MFEQVFHSCPSCNSEIRQRLSDGEDLRCPSCNRRYGVMLDKATGKAGLVDLSAEVVPEPLYLPKGSIRALVTLTLAFSCWILILRGEHVPGYLFSLMLTVIGYYFGFRHRVKAAGSRIYDISAKEQDPLFLPAGLIRFVLSVGFMVSGIVLYRRGSIKFPVYAEFFIVLTGMIVGHLFGRALSVIKETPVFILVNHAKGAIVLCCTLALCASLITASRSVSVFGCLFLAATISFYFGSRS